MSSGKIVSLKLFSHSHFISISFPLAQSLFHFLHLCPPSLSPLFTFCPLLLSFDPPSLALPPSLPSSLPSISPFHLSLPSLTPPSLSLNSKEVVKLRRDKNILHGKYEHMKKLTGGKGVSEMVHSGPIPSGLCYSTFTQNTAPSLFLQIHNGLVCFLLP